LELELLDRAVAVAYPFPEDQALARIPDAQGMGGVLAKAGAERIAAKPNPVAEANKGTAPESATVTPLLDVRAQLERKET
jgi:hypothetical protein